jgi:hypothetical protein
MSDAAFSDMIRRAARPPRPAPGPERPPVATFGIGRGGSTPRRYRYPPRDMNAAIRAARDALRGYRDVEYEVGIDQLFGRG